VVGVLAPQESSLLGLVSVVAFGLLFGVLGVLFATPLAVVTMVLVRELYVKDVLESPEARAVANDQ
jgi:predicted PurR-regulated permease PerM